MKEFDASDVAEVIVGVLFAQIAIVNVLHRKGLLDLEEVRGQFGIMRREVEAAAPASEQIFDALDYALQSDDPASTLVAMMH